MNTKGEWNHWLILAKDRIYTQGIFKGTYDEAVAYCNSVYQDGYVLDRDNRNDNHPFWVEYNSKITSGNG